MGTSHRQKPVKAHGRARSGPAWPSCSVLPDGYRGGARQRRFDRASGTPPRSASSASARCTWPTASSPPSSPSPPGGPPSWPIRSWWRPSRAARRSRRPTRRATCWPGPTTRPRPVSQCPSCRPDGRDGRRNSSWSTPPRARAGCRWTSTADRRLLLRPSEGVRLGRWPLDRDHEPHRLRLARIARDRRDRPLDSGVPVDRHRRSTTRLKDQTLQHPCRRDALPAGRPDRLDQRAGRTRLGHRRRHRRFVRRGSTRWAEKLGLLRRRSSSRSGTLRSQVVGTIDFDDAVDASPRSRRYYGPTGSSTPSPTASSAATSCASACSPRSIRPTSPP